MSFRGGRVRQVEFGCQRRRQRLVIIWNRQKLMSNEKAKVGCQREKAEVGCQQEKAEVG